MVRRSRVGSEELRVTGVVLLLARRGGHDHPGAETRDLRLLAPGDDVPGHRVRPVRQAEEAENPDRSHGLAVLDKDVGPGRDPRQCTGHRQRRTESQPVKLAGASTMRCCSWPDRRSARTVRNRPGRVGSPSLRPFRLAHPTGVSRRKGRLVSNHELY